MNQNYTKKACLAGLPALAIILLLIAPAISFAQNRNTIDSLKSIINNKKTEDTTIVNVYIDLTVKYENYNLDTALYYSDQALKKSLKINYKKGVADACRQKGIINILLNNYKQADSLLNIAISIYREINYQYGIMKCYICFSANAFYKGEYRLITEYCINALKIAENNNFIEDKAKILDNMGAAYSNMGDYSKAIEYELNALKIFEELSNKKEIAICNTNIGCFFLRIEEFDKSIKYLNKALELFVELEYTREQSICLKNIGIAFTKQGKFDEALQNANKALSLSKKSNNLKGIAVNYNNIGYVYYKIEKYNKAAEYYNKSLEISKRAGNEIVTAECYYYIAMLETELKNYDFAEKYCLKSIELFEQINKPDDQHAAMEVLSNIYYGAGKYKKSHDICIKAHIIKDSLFNIEKNQKIAQLEEKYLNEKLEKQNLTLKFENNLHQTEILQQIKIRNMNFIAFIFAIIAILMILIQFRKKNMAYKFLVQKNMDLVNNKEELKKIKEQTRSFFSNGASKTSIPDDKKEKKLKKIKKLFNEDKIFKMHDLSLYKLAKRLSTNSTYLSKLINDEFGKNYSEFINEYRINEAIFMLSDYKTSNKFSIETIAKEAGFKTTSSFNSAFKKFTGITPSVFKYGANNQ